MTSSYTLAFHFHLVFFVQAVTHANTEEMCGSSFTLVLPAQQSFSVPREPPLGLLCFCPAFRASEDATGN